MLLQSVVAVAEIFQASGVVCHGSNTNLIEASALATTHHVQLSRLL